MHHSTTIDMCSPDQACAELGVAADGLLTMINRGELAAYNLAGSIRLRRTDVAALARQLAAA